MNRFLSVLFLLSFSPWAYSQPKVWTLADCIEQAFEKNIQINQTKLNNELNRVSFHQALGSRTPNISGNANHSYNFGRPLDPTTNQYINKTLQTDNFSVNGNVTLFNGFQITNTIKQNRLNYEAGMLDVEKIKNDIAISVAFAYLQVLFAGEQIEILKNQMVTSRAQLERSQRLVTAGNLAESNLLQIKSQVASDNLNMVNAENQLSIAKLNLMQLMEIPVTDDFSIERPNFSDAMISKLNLKTKEEIYAIALSNQPQIKSAEIKRNSSIVGLNVARGARLPRLSLNGVLATNYSSASKLYPAPTFRPRDYPFPQQFKDNFYQNLGLNLSLPVVANRTIKSGIERAEVNRKNSELNEQNVKNQLRKSIEQAYTDMIAASKKHEASKEQLAAWESSYQNSEKKYNVGLINALDYLVEKNNYLNGQSSLLQAKYDYIFKSKILDFYQGIPIGF